MTLFKPKDGNVFDLFSLKGRVSLITGGARGIGLAAAIGLAEAGSDIAITYNSSSKGHIDGIIKQFTQLGVKFKAYQADVSKKEQIFSTTEQVLKDFGRLDVVVPNAGVAYHGAAEDFTEDDYHKILSVNLDGAFFTAQAAAKVFKEQVASGTLDQGRIVFTASVSSSIVNYPQKQAAYNASKAGLVRLAKCLAVEWIDFARVNAISPGYIDTEILHVLPKETQDVWYSLIPAKRFSDASELKGAYVYFASNASSYATGSELTIGGGYTLI